MKVSFDDIENAFYFINMQHMFGNTALLSKITGGIFYISELGDSDELPDDIEDSDIYIEIPHKNELNLGKKLIFEFISEHAPEKEERVSNIFRKKGAYSKYKDLLEEIGLLEKWYDFENSKQNEALKQWCLENGIDLIG